MIKVLIHTITIGQFRSTSKEVKSGLHYLNEKDMNLEGEILKLIIFKIWLSITKTDFRNRFLFIF